MRLLFGKKKYRTTTVLGVIWDRYWFEYWHDSYQNTDNLSVAKDNYILYTLLDYSSFVQNVRADKVSPDIFQCAYRYNEK